MNGVTRWALIGRAVAAFAFTLAVLHALPSAVLLPTRPLLIVGLKLAVPYVEHVHITHRDHALHVDGIIRAQMTLETGAPLPVAPVSMRKGLASTLQLLAVAMSAFAAPATPWRVRVHRLPIALALGLLACAFSLTIEIQESVLREIGQTWLPQHNFAATGENVRVFEDMKRRFDAARWIRSFTASGGALFLAVLAGLAAHAPLPLPKVGRARLGSNQRPWD